MKVVIHADSGSIIGVGHVMRCLVLADALKADNIIFTCRNLPGNISAVIESRGYKARLLSADIALANSELLSFLESEKPDLLIIDSYDIDAEFENRARPYTKNIMVIDDLANRKHDADILLDQNPNPAAHSRYNNLTMPTTIKLLGLQYALIGGEFSKHKKDLQASSSPDKRIKNILIFFGGGDHQNLTEKTLNVLLGLKNIKFDIVVGASNPMREQIRVFCEKNENFTYHCQINNMAEIMAKADLFIGAGGSTSWERMCIGLPAIIISIAENQEEICSELAKADVIKYLGKAEEFSSEKLLQNLNEIIENPAWLNEAARVGQEMLDGDGAKRVAAVIKSLSIDLKKAEDADCENIFNWRNAEENRRFSLNSDKIDYSGHQKWFAGIIADSSSNLLVAYQGNQPQAVVRFDFKENEALISVYMVPGNHGKGLGLPILFAAENWLRHSHPNIKQINAKVVKENIASVKIFTRALYNVTNSDIKTHSYIKRLT